jgi:superfamily I DNA and/or RNA helicase
MNVSLYERLYKLIERENDGDVNKCPLFTHLKEQIDMLPPICELVSHLFYKNQLQSSKNLTFKQDHPLQSFWPNGFPVVLCNMVPAVGRKESLIVDDNTTDNVEIQKTIQVVGALQSCMTDNATSVVVITYSTAQKLHMERLLNSSQPQCHKAPGTVPVLTVDECIAQDRRYDVAILSTVTSELNMHSVKAINSGETIRKQGLETLGDPNRLCAAISTSRQGLIILGNADLLSMKTLTNSEVWEGLVLYCQTKRCILGRDEFPLSKPIPSEALQKSTLPSASKSSSSNVAERRPSPPPPVRQPVSSATPRKKGKKGKGKK